MVSLHSQGEQNSFGFPSCLRPLEAILCLVWTFPFPLANTLCCMLNLRKKKQNKAITPSHLNIFQGLFVVLLYSPPPPPPRAFFFHPKETGQIVPQQFSDVLLLPRVLFALPSLPSNSSGLLLSIMISERLYVLCSENPPCFLLLGNPLPAAVEDVRGGGKRWDSEDEWLWPSHRRSRFCHAVREHPQCGL